MKAPPACVSFVARTHWIVGGAIVGATALLHPLTTRLPGFEFGPTTYWATGGIAAFYLLAGTLVWFGLPLGPLLSRVCALIYLPRPSFGSLVWETMDRPDFKAHFRRG